MKLKRLELFGFKSFADRTVIEFDEGITGVVGPNGSGKSNISDAVRWVLGEQSARSLRGGRMEDIIFGGSEKRKALAYSEVTLIFDNEDRFLPIDFAEVAVTRRVYRSGDSEYYINRSVCRLRDVVQLFRDSGIGREGYSIIGQGRVDEILSNKPEDRRNVFHEAAGIMKFRAGKEEAQRNLANTQGNLTRITDIMQVMETQLGPLRRQSENAREYRKLSERLRQLEINRFIAEYERMTRQTEKDRERLGSLEGILAQQQQDGNSRREQLEADEARLSALEGEWAASQQQAAALQANLAAMDAAQQMDRERTQLLQEEFDRQGREREAALERAQQLTDEAAEKQAVLADSRAAREQLAGRIAAEEEKLAALDGQLEAAEAAVEQGKQQAMAALGRLGDVKSALSRMEGQKQALGERLAQVSGQLERGTASEESWVELTEQTRQGLEQLTGRVEEARRSEAEGAAQQRETQDALASLEAQAARTREAQREIRTRLTMLENMKRDYEGYSNTVKALLKDAGREPELGRAVEAVVAEVVQVPREYLLAVETALGAASQNIITRDEQAAKRLISHLRSRQYGRATFLPLSVIRGRTLDTRERIAHEGLCGVASELVGCEEKYRAVVDNLLGRTLIARDLDAAIAIARASQNNLRVVTLQGDVMNPGGSMTGGSVRSRTTSVLGRDQQIEENGARLRELAGKLEQMEASRQRGEALLAQQQQENALRRGQLHTLEIDLARERERLDKAQANAQRHIREREELEAERDRLGEARRELEERMEQAARDGDAIQQGSDQSQAEMARRQREINIMREDRDELVGHLSMLRATAMADERDRAAVEGQIARDRQDAQRHRQAAEEALAQRSANTQRRQQLAEAMEQRRQQREQTDGAISGAQERTRALETQREQQRARIAQRTGQLRELEQASLRTQQQLYEARGQTERLTRELEALQNRIWELYELTYANALPLRDETLMNDEAQKEMERLRRSIRALGSVNMEAIEEYAQVKEQYEEYMTQSTDLLEAKARLEGMIAELSGEMEKLFRESFTRLNEYFGETFRALFGGGQAFIRLQDEGNILESGIDMHVQPPGKKLQLLTLLSGGERALTAIALLFAMLRLKPTPFCILDEIEAALDEANISHFTDYVKGYAQKTQFVIITHRKSTMECCDTLYGVTMQEKGVSKMLRVKMSEITQQEVS